MRTQAHRTVLFILLLPLLVLLVPLGGCADLQGAIAQTTQWRDQAQVLRDELEGRLVDLEMQRRALPDGSPQGAQIDAAIALARTKVRALETGIAHADLVLDEARRPTDGLTRLAEGLSGWVPAPAQGPLVLGAALIATLVRSRQLKQGAASIIRSIEHVRNRDEQFNDLFGRHADAIRTIQTPAARKLVDRTVAN